MIGIYGLVAYAVVQRTKEFGIRRALGAGQRSILRLVISQGVRLALVGVVLGVAGALVLTRIIGSLLFQISATDPFTFAGIGVMVILVTVIASYLPAHRATKVNPMTALRLG